MEEGKSGHERDTHLMHVPSESSDGECMPGLMEELQTRDTYI